jgi:predicted dehydrogenase
MMKNNRLPFNPNGKIRVGIIGVGNWAIYGHIPSLMLLPDYEVIALQSRRKEAALAAAEQFGIRYVVDTIKQLAEHPEVDIVLVLTTAAQHEEGVRAAIAAGKGVYSEWPFTINTSIAKELKEMAVNAGVYHIVGLQRRFAPVFRYLHDLLIEGYVGRLRSVRLHVSMNGFQALRAASLKWTIDPLNFSHTIAIYGGHFLDALFYAVGKPLAFSSHLINQFKEVTIAGTDERYTTTAPDQLLMIGGLAGNAVFSVHIEGGKRNNSGVQLDITGDEGDIRITNVSAFGGIGQDYVIEGASGNKLPLKILVVPEIYRWVPESGLPSGVTELANLYVAFANDIKNGTQTVTNFKDALWMHELFDLINYSSENGQLARVEE